ncbi:MAG: stage II sporulation protein M [Clostridia bacterium]|nr:stage II sporulation protein M [Clostridia bacterium]
MFRVIKKRTGRLPRVQAVPLQKRSYSQELFIFFLFLAGVFIGTLAVRKNSSLLLERLLTLFENYITVKAKQSFAVNFASALFRQLLLFLTPFCIGLCAVGMPFLYLLPIAYGCGTGLIGAYLYHTYRLKGIGYCALILYPGQVLTVAALQFACAAAIGMSRALMADLLQNDAGERPVFRAYCVRFLIAVGFAVGAAVLETALHTVFSGYFQFS